jgi:hypothetical protein
VLDTYEARFAKGEEPDNIDKEFLRKWYASQCDPYKDAILPAAPATLVNELSRRYILIFEILTQTAATTDPSSTTPPERDEGNAARTESSSSSLSSPSSIGLFRDIVITSPVNNDNDALSAAIENFFQQVDN